MSTQSSYYWILASCRVALHNIRKTRPFLWACNTTSPPGPGYF